MEQRRTISTPAGEKSGVPVDVVSSTEAYNTYTLQDGTVLRTRSVLVDVIRTDEFDADGNPIYVTRTQNVVVPIHIPEGLRK